MSRPYRFRGRLIPHGTTASPGTTGWDDVGSATGGFADASVNVATIVDSTMAGNGRTVKALQLADTAFTTPDWEIDFVKLGVITSAITGPYSISFKVRQTGTNLGAVPILQVLDNTTTTWSITSGNQTRFTIGGIAAATALTPYNSFYRCELQVDNGRTSKIVFRVYLEDGTTVLRSMAGSPASGSVSMTKLRFGQRPAGTWPNVQYTDIEVSLDTYDLDGQFTSNPASPTPASTSATGMTFVADPVPEARFHYNATTGKTDPASSPSYDAHDNLDFASTYNRKLNLAIPDTGTAPAKGWPLILGWHGGFFTSGDRNSLPTAFRDDAIANNFAFASAEYVLASIQLIGSYPAYGTANAGGRYPSFGHDAKEAAAWLQSKASLASGGDGTYNIDGDSIIALGYSAGAWPAGFAAYTYDLVDDTATPTPNKLSLAAATAAGAAWSTGRTHPDPRFIAVLMFHGVIDMDAARTWDPSYPNSGSGINLAYRFFQGLTSSANQQAPLAPHTRLQTLIGQQTGPLPPTAYVRGTADHIVHWEHEEALATALLAKGADYTEFVTPSNHDKGIDIYDRDEIFGWLTEKYEASLSSPTPAIPPRVIII